MSNTSIVNLNLNLIYGLYCVCHPGEVVRYVGQTRVGMGKRFSAHRYAAEKTSNLPVHNWMRKHGIENIVYKILEECQFPEMLNEAEIRWIDELETFGYPGLNLSMGGSSLTGYKHTEEALLKMANREYSDETRLKMSKSAKKRGISEAARQSARDRKGSLHPRAKITEEQVGDFKELIWNGSSLAGAAEATRISVATATHINNNRIWTHVFWPIGPPRQMDTKGRMSRAHENRPPDSEETKAKRRNSVSAAWTDERRRAQAENRMGANNPQYGRRYTEEEKRALSLSRTTLTEDDIREIKHLRSTGLLNREIAALYEGQGESNISCITSGKKFSWIV